MSVYFRTNLSSDLDGQMRQQLADVVDKRPGEWVITLTDKPDASAWDVSIDGPDGFVWAKRFKTVERQADLVVRSIRTAVDSPRTDLTSALSELAKAGLAFTTEVGPDGETVYIIDRIRLREEEMIQLKNTGALTREGIRQYLVDRAA